MTEEEFQRLRAKYGDIPVQEPNREGMSDDEFAGMQARFGEVDFSPPPESPAPAPASLTDKTLHVLKALPEAGFVFLEQGHNLEKGLADPALRWAGVKGGSKDVWRSMGNAFGFGSDPADYAWTDEPWTKRVLGTENYDRLYEATAAETVDKEQYPVVDRLRTLTEWAAAGPLKLLRGNFRDAAVDVAQGTGAAAGEAVDDWLSGGEPTGLGEIGGGVAGALFGGRIKTPKAKEAERTAYTFIREHADDPDTALARLKEALARGDEGTLGDLTGDVRIAGMERAAMRADYKFKRQIDDVNNKLQAQIAERVKGKFGTGDADLAEVAAGDAVTEGVNRVQDDVTRARSTADNAAAQATAAAADAAKRMETPGVPWTTSEAIKKRLDYDDMMAKTVEDAEWKKWRESTDVVDVTPVYDAIDDWIATVDIGEAQVFKRKYGQLMNDIHIWDDAPPAGLLDVDGKAIDLPRTGAATPNDFSKWKTRVDEMIDKNVRPDGSYTADGRLLIQMKNTAMDALQSNELYAKAREATRVRMRKFREGRVNEARFAKNAGPETYTDRVNLKGNYGAQAVREFTETGDPELIDLVVEHLKAEAKKTGVDAKFVDTYAGAIDNLPLEHQRQFRVAAITDTEKLRTADVAEKTAKRGEEYVKNETRKLRESAIGKYAENKRKYLKSLLADENSGEKLQELKDILKLRGEKENFAGALRDAVEDMYLQGGDMTPKVRSDQLKAFNNTLKQLQDAGLMDAADIEDIAVEMSRSLTLNQRVGQLDALMVDADALTNVKASILAIGAMNLIPGAGGTESLVLTGAIRRFFKQQLDNHGTKHASVEALERMMRNPEAYLDANRKYDGVEGALEYMYNRATNAVQGSQAAAALNEEEE